MSRTLKIMLSILAVLSMTGCETYNAGEQPEGLATTHAIKEDSAQEGIILDPARRDKLGLQTAPVSRRTISATKRRVGWFIAPPASETVTRSPVAGFIEPASIHDWPEPGQHTSSTNPSVRIHVFLAPQEISQLVLAKEDNDIQMQQALVTMELTEAQLKLATTAQDAVTGVRIQQLREAYEHSRVAYREALDKVPYLIQEPYDTGVVFKPLSVTSAGTGRIFQVHVTQGQFVQAGDPLWTVGDWTTLWIRVPVFSAELHELPADRTAAVEIPGHAGPLIAKPLNIQRSVEPQTRTAGLLFSVANPDEKIRVGQSAIVSLRLAHETSVLTVPQSAVLYDSFGQAYCYAAESGSDRYRRRRLEPGASTDSDLTILRGIDEDDVVVSLGAEQLAAEESKSELTTDDDD